MVVATFLIHKPGDAVGVATEDFSSGEAVTGRFRDSSDSVELVSKADIPLGHKIAITALKAGDVIVEYGEEIGVAKQDIEPGEHVHVHNLKGQRWA